MAYICTGVFCGFFNTTHGKAYATTAHQAWFLLRIKTVSFIVLFSRQNVDIATGVYIGNGITDDAATNYIDIISSLYINDIPTKITGQSLLIIDVYFAGFNLLITTAWATSMFRSVIN